MRKFAPEPLSNNLYELWNRLSSGSYFPPPVRRVDIPKVDGGTRPLGIPTVADRVAQEVARRYLEPRLEPVFHADSHGYRPGKSAIDAVRQARQRCSRYDWVLDLDVKAYFDSIDWELMLRAVRRHTNQPWVLLYIERWLKAPMQMEDGSVVPRMSGTPQGGVISPILANLFLHYAFDMWMAINSRPIPFERYADDAICHCKSAEEARALWSASADRFTACKLVLRSWRSEDEVASVRSRTAGVMTTLMRNGRDRRSDNPSGPTRYLSARYCLGPISGSHQGQRPQWPHRDEGTPPRENRPHTWLHPNASQKSQIPLAPRAPSIHGPGCVKTRRGITTPGILSPVVMRRAKKHKNSSSARHYDQIRFRFHTAWAHRYRTELSNECLVLGVNRRSNLALTQFWCTWD